MYRQLNSERLDSFKKMMLQDYNGRFLDSMSDEEFWLTIKAISENFVNAIRVIKKIKSTPEPK